MTRSIFLKPLAASLCLLFMGATSVTAQSSNSFGDTYIAAGNSSAHGIAVTTSDLSGYGGIDFSTAIRGNRTLSTFNNLSTDYKITQGPIGQGSPRFVIETNAGNLFVYVGTYPNYNDAAGDWANTGNLLTSSSIVDASQLGGSFYDTYGNVQATYGDLKIKAVYLVMDGPSQTVVFDNTIVNNSLFTYDHKQNKHD